LPWRTTKLLLPMPPNKQPFGLIPIPKKIHLSQSLKKHLLWKGVELSHPPLFTQKKPFWKRKKKRNPNSLPPFLKAPFTTCNSFNLIELSTLYTYWNLIIKKKTKPCERGKKKKKKKNFTPLLPLNFSL